MGVVTKTTQEFICDECKAAIPEHEVFAGDRLTLWSDRDVVATASVGLHICIPYSSQPNICCRKCAARLLRQFADRIIREEVK